MSALSIPVVDTFAGEFGFLSNFAPAPTPYGGWLYPTSEHAYASAKTRDAAAIAAIRDTDDPAQAKVFGRAAPLVDGWESAKFAAMEAVVHAKFEHNPQLADRLLATHGWLLVEGNTWHDQVWGSCRCDEHRAVPGGNALGVILMAVRMRLTARRACGPACE